MLELEMLIKRQFEKKKYLDLLEAADIDKPDLGLI